MGIFDFLGDLSSKRGKELGLGGFKSLLGTRKAAEAGALGDEMMKITGNDSLPGYFNEQTREYVPWYVDLFDGGGLNSAGGEAGQMPAAETGLLGGGRVQRGAGVQAQAAPDFQYDYPTEFPLEPSPNLMEQPENLAMSSLTTPGTGWNNAIGQTREQPSAQMPSSDFTQSSGYMPQPSMPQINLPQGEFLPHAALQSQLPAPPASENSLLDRALSGELAESNRAALNGNASTSNPSLPQSQSVGPTEFERFKSKFEKELKANGLWGFPDRIQETLDSLKARGLNY